MIIAAQGISVVRDGREVVRGVDLTARPGEVLGLIGPNGAGKTTLLRILAALEPPARGTVRYDGLDGERMGRRRLGREVAYLAQSGRIHWPMTVENVVALGRLPHASPPDEDARAVARAMAAAEVEHLKDRTTGSLSGGERMRVLLARALAVEARALLADEPVAALDPYHQLHAMELMRETARSGVTVVVVLHDLTLAARFCDRLALMQAGRIIIDGEAAAVLDSERLGETYGVDLERGTRHGEPFAIPWRRRPRGP